MKKIMVNIQNYDDRMSMVLSLANSGYSVTTKVDEDNSHNKTYWVIFELADLNIK